MKWRMGPPKFSLLGHDRTLKFSVFSRKIQSGDAAFAWSPHSKVVAGLVIMECGGQRSADAALDGVAGAFRNVQACAGE